jgi:predicted metal-dependent HD superfamily phosphohydrolase
MTNLLSILWQQDTKTLGIQEAQSTQAWQMLERAYSAPNRHYHNLDHLQQLHELALAYSSYIEQLTIIKMAIWFHDAVYSPLRKDNERKSADMAYHWLQSVGIAETTAQSVQRFILATQNHTLRSYEPDLAFFLDFDLAILASPPEAYKSYTEKIRKEYQLVPSLLYRKGRKKALTNFLERNHIYHSSIFIQKYEAQARANIQREIASL